MATADQIKSLIRSHFNREGEHFYTIALQVAAHEAKKGNINLAGYIRNLIDDERKRPKNRIKIVTRDLKGLVVSESSQISKNTLVISSDLKIRIDQLIHEFRQKSKLKSFGLNHRRKLLLLGSPGTGKTMTASVIAHELGLPINTIQVDRLVTKFMGETSAKLRQIFDLIQEQIGVYLFDEFDAIGGERNRDNDVGEMRRVLNSFLQFIEQDNSDSIIVAATNNPDLLDHALFRRFDDVLHYHIPTEFEIKQLIKNALGNFITERFGWKKAIAQSKGLSHSEIVLASNDALKNAILSDKYKISSADLCKMLSNRHNIRKGINNKIE